MKSTPLLTNAVPTNPSARLAWLSYQLKLRGSSVAALARQEGVNPAALHRAMNNSSSHLERAIATALGMPVQTIFPERYDARGRRLNRTRAPNRSTRAAAVTVEKTEAI
jgi:Ner family transcriptional regulator